MQGLDPTNAEAIAAFERQSKRLSIAPPAHYPPSVSGDSITTNDLAYTRHTRAGGMRDGHGWVYVDFGDDAVRAGRG